MKTIHNINDLFINAFSNLRTIKFEKAEFNSDIHEDFEKLKSKTNSIIKEQIDKTTLV